MKIPGIYLLVVALSLNGCSGMGTTPEGPSWFRASLEGEVTGNFDGTGSFSFERDYAETPYYFKVHARGTDPEVTERFYIRWPVTSRPRVGSYLLVPHEHGHGSTTGVTAHYSWSRGDNETSPATIEVYVALGGVVEITHSSRDAVEGTIRFTGIQTTRYATSGVIRTDPAHQPDPTAPTIEVTGTFRAPYWPGFGTP